MIFQNSIKYENNSETKSDMSKVPIDFEVKKKRDRYTKHFRKIYWTYEVSVYNDAVHYFDGRKWESIDIRLKIDDITNEYENKNNSFKIILSKKLKEGKDFKLQFDDYKISCDLKDISDSEVNIIEGEKNKSNNLKIVENINQ